MTFIDIETIGAVEPIPGYKGRFVHSDSMTLAHWKVEQGAAFPEHSHPHEQFSMVSEGEFELTVGGEKAVLRPGMVAVIPSEVPHSGVALTACRIVDVFQPVREDYR